VFYFTRNNRQWLHVKYNTEIISKLF